MMFFIYSMSCEIRLQNYKFYLLGQFLASLFLNAQADDSSIWKTGFGEIYCGEHFDDVFLNKDKTFSTNVLFILHREHCSQDFHDVTAQVDRAPPVNVLVKAHYNDTKFREATQSWLILDPSVDLWVRYGSGSHCCYVYLFKRGSTADEPVVYDEEVKLDMWVWRELQMSLTLVNQLNQPIHVQVQNVGQSPAVAPVIVLALRSVTITVYPISVALTFINHGKTFISGKAVMKSSKLIIGSDKITGIENPDKSFTKVRTKVKNEEVIFTNWLYAHAIRNYILITQPPLVPAHITSGVGLTSVANEVKTRLQQYFTMNIHSGQKQVCNPIDALLNSKNTKNECSRIPLDASIQDSTIAVLIALAENFCSCSLKLSSLEPMTVFDQGFLQYTAVHPPLTHVITVSLQVMSDHAAAPWRRVVTCPGQATQRIDLKDGDVVVFESGRCWHGREGVYPGKFLTEVNAHFVPVDWDFELNSSFENGLFQNAQAGLNSSAAHKLRDEL